MFDLVLLTITVAFFLTTIALGYATDRIKE